MKRTKLLLLVLAFLSYEMVQAQVNENFSDGNFTTNPVWVGNTADWTVNSSGQLQSNNTVANSTFYLSTANALATQTQWDFYVHFNFNTSSLNYTDVFLTASASDLTQAATTGYFVRIGNTNDEVALYRKDASGATKIIDGVDDITNNSDNVLKIRVIRDASNRFSLFRDFGATGNYVSEGSVIDATYTTSAFFGILVKQSTASFFQKHFFDDIVVQPYTPDVTPPSIQSVSTTSATTLDVLFNEPVSAATAQNTANYSISNGIGNPSSAVLDAANNALVHLTFATPFTNGTTNTLTVNGVQDLAGNALSNRTSNFSFTTAVRYNILIDEIMADPTPVVGLPNAEYVELRNVSGKDMNLQGWRLTTSTTTSGAFPSYVLPADSFLILTSTTQVVSFTPFGRTLGITSFPALDNNGTLLSLISKEGVTIHAVEYNIGWYANPAKNDGGWSLEMIDPRNPCTGSSNWKASTDASGGTPGRKNSVDGTNTDQTPPSLRNGYLLDATTIILSFDEPVDSTSGATASNYSLSPSVNIISATALAPTFTQVQLKVSAPLSAQTVYTVTATNVTDCKGNKIGSRNNLQLGTPGDPILNDVVINEILFDPRPNGADYVEVYNRSNKIVDASKLYVANRNSSGVASSLQKLSDVPFYLFPGSYAVVTTDATSLATNYLVQNPAAVLQVSSMPSFPDNEGTVVLLNIQGAVVDEVHYLDDWQFNLLSDPEGVALERIDPDGPSQSANNWHSAASTAGYGTPGYKNSQYKQVDSLKAKVTVTPTVFSPDNDGYNDIATIQYQMSSSTGFVANITIFDAAGRMVRRLVKNQTLGPSGSWNWDGLGEQGQKLPIGTYIIYTEFFNLQGKKEHFKNTVVLARRLN